MASNIKTLKEDNGDIVYPQTLTGAVYTSNNTALDTELAKYVTAEDIATTATSFGTITAGMIDWTTMVDKIYPVGSIYMSATLSTTAAVEAALGGTWIAWGAGRVPVGVDTNDTDFDTAEETGGEKTHTLTVAEIPSHSHSAYLNGGNLASAAGRLNFTTNTGQEFAGSIKAAGGDGAHNNLQPYITCYMYKRTA